MSKKNNTITWRDEIRYFRSTSGLKESVEALSDAQLMIVIKQILDKIIDETTAEAKKNQAITWQH